MTLESQERTPAGTAESFVAALDPRLSHLAGEGAAPPDAWPPLPLFDEPGVAAVRRALLGESSLPAAFERALASVPDASLTMHATLAGGMPVLALADAEQLATVARELGAPPPLRREGGLLPVPGGGRLLALVRRAPYAQLSASALGELEVAEDDWPSLSSALLVEHFGMAYLMRRMLWCAGDRLFDDLISSAYAQCRLRQRYDAELVMARIGGERPELAELSAWEHDELMCAARVAAVALAGRLGAHVRHASPISLALLLLRARCDSLVDLAEGRDVARPPGPPDSQPDSPPAPGAAAAERGATQHPDPREGRRARLEFAPGPQAADQVKAFIDQFTRRHGLAESLRARTQVALDELLSNALKYGQLGLAAEPETLVLSLRMDGEVLVVELVDPGVAFDPTAAPDPDTSQTLEQRPIGGLGVMLARRLSDAISYTRHHGLNHTTLRFVASRAPDEPAGASGHVGP